MHGARIYTAAVRTQKILRGVGWGGGGGWGGAGLSNWMDVLLLSCSSTAAFQTLSLWLCSTQVTLFPVRSLCDSVPHRSLCSPSIHFVTLFHTGHFVPRLFTLRLCSTQVTLFPVRSLCDSVPHMFTLFPVHSLCDSVPHRSLCSLSVHFVTVPHRSLCSLFTLYFIPHSGWLKQQLVTQVASHWQGPHLLNTCSGGGWRSPRLGALGLPIGPLSPPRHKAPRKNHCTLLLSKQRL